LAACLDENKYEYRIATSEGYKKFVGDNYLEIPSLNADEFEQKTDLRKHDFVYSKELLQSYVNSELKLINEYKPNLVVGDMRISLGISAKIAKIPYLNIQNAYWSQFAEAEKMMPDISFAKFLSVKKQKMIFNKKLQLVNANFIYGYNTIRSKYGLPKVRTMEEMYSGGDMNLYMDIPMMAPTSHLPEHCKYIGPVVDFFDIPLPAWWENIDKAKRTVYCSLGSTGNTKKMNRMVKALVKLDMNVILVTSGRFLQKKLPSDFYVCEYFPITKVMEKIDLVICNGGSGTIYQAIKGGTPVLATPTNLDQMLACFTLERKHIGKVLRYRDMNRRRIRASINDLLNNEIYKDGLKKAKNQMDQYDTKELFNRYLETMLT
jgi:UDP:flavonoid glycosyltransferase YjiC (YdhE family)